MDEDGNVRTVEVRVTMRDIFARSIRSANDNVKLTAVLAIVALAAIAFALLLSGYNITVVVVGSRGGAEQKLRTLRRIGIPQEGTDRQAGRQASCRRRVL
ncbi:MAG: hypothetical protein R2912_08190 [Eubacteriales bacterium]